MAKARVTALGPSVLVVAVATVVDEDGDGDGDGDGGDDDDDDNADDGDGDDGDGIAARLPSLRHVSLLRGAHARMAVQLGLLVHLVLP